MGAFRSTIGAEADIPHAKAHRRYATVKCVHPLSAIDHSYASDVTHVMARLGVIAHVISASAAFDFLSS